MQLENTITQVPRAGFQLRGEFLHLTYPKKVICERSPSCLGKQPTPTELRSSLLTYAQMLSFGERNYCNILLNFGNHL
jgi:hypothetical protein